MGLMDIFGGKTVESIGNIVDEVFTSEDERNQAKIQLKKIEARLKEKQMSINLADAQSKAGGLSGFMQRSWRPMIGMSCALAIFWEYVLSKFILFFLGIFHYEVLDLPVLDMGTLMPLVMSLLGMGALRTFEKTKGVAK
jgi:hypothetical protein